MQQIAYTDSPINIAKVFLGNLCKMPRLIKTEIDTLSAAKPSVDEGLKATD